MRIASIAYSVGSVAPFSDGRVSARWDVYATKGQVPDAGIWPPRFVLDVALTVRIGVSRTGWDYGVTLLMCVAQLPRGARVPSHWPNGADRYCA